MSITLTTSQEFVFKLGILFHIRVLLTFPVSPCMPFLLPSHQCVKVLHHILCNLQAFLYAITWPKICLFSSLLPLPITWPQTHFQISIRWFLPLPSPFYPSRKGKFPYNCPVSIHSSQRVYFLHCMLCKSRSWLCLPVTSLKPS